MKKLLFLATLAAGLSGCTRGYRQNQPALVGGLLGVGTGAIVGGAVTRRGEGSAGGRRYRSRNWVRYDDYGRRYRVAC